MSKYVPDPAETFADSRQCMGLESLASKLKALSDPTRLSILDLLMEGVQCNCELSDQLGISLSLISHHMRVLREAGLVNGERDHQDARWIYYSVDTVALDQLKGRLNHLLDARRMKPRVPSCGPRGHEMR